MQIKDWIAKNTIYMTRAGSESYGTNIETSDTDLRGVAIPPLNYIFGLDRFQHAQSKQTSTYYKGIITVDSDDVEVYSLQRFVELAAHGNPNVIELLFTEESDWILSTPYWKQLVDIRESFLSKVLKHRFSGYAVQQLKRIESSYQYLVNPPSHEPSREEYGLHLYKFPEDQLNAVDKILELIVEEWLIDQTELPEDLKIKLYPEIIDMTNIVLNQIGVDLEIKELKSILERAAFRVMNFDTNFMEYLAKEKAYRAAVKMWEGYRRWLKERNAKRKELEAKFGYDTKHAARLVQLMRMAREILTTGKVQVKRPDAEELKAIRYFGTWTYSELVEFAEKEDKELTQLMKASKLRNDPDRVLIGRTMEEIHLRFYHDKDYLKVA
jgi:predicted nucleotidyltransferase